MLALLLVSEVRNNVLLISRVGGMRPRTAHRIDCSSTCSWRHWRCVGEIPSLTIPGRIIVAIDRLGILASVFIKPWDIMTAKSNGSRNKWNVEYLFCRKREVGSKTDD